MAVTWGAAAGDTSKQFRLGYEFAPVTVGENDASVNVTCYVYIWTEHNTTDSSNSFAWSGDLGSGGHVSVAVSTPSGTTWSTSNKELIRTITGAIAPSYAGAVPVTVNANLHGIDYSGADHTALVSGTYYVPQRPYHLPADPTVAAVARVSDTQHTVSWTNNATAEAAYTNIEVQRWDNVTAGFYALATVAGSATSYSDTTTVADRTYEYRVRATNSGGASGYDTTGTIHTTPAAPTDVVAAKSGSDVSVTWANPSVIDENVEIEHSAGGAYSAEPTSPLAADAIAYTDVAPSGGSSHVYRVRTVVDHGGAGELVSAWATSNTVSVESAPNAPVSLAPSSTPQDATGSLILSWTHNPTDGTAQTHYELQYRIVGAGAWTGIAEVASAEAHHDLAANTLANGNTYEWQARTKGNHADASPWSASATFATSARPTVAVTYPGVDGDTHALPALEATFSYSAGTAPQTAYRATLYADVSGSPGATIESAEVASADGAHTFAYTLLNGVTYHIGIKVRDSVDFWSAEVVRRFVVAYAGPMKPTLSATYDDATGTVSVAVTNPAPQNAEPDAVSNNVYRTIAGVRELVATGVAENGSVTDYLPTVGGTNTYEVEAVSATPTLTMSDPFDCVVASAWTFFNCGASHSSVARVGYNTVADGACDRDRVLHAFEGRTYPVEYQGDARSLTVAFSGVIKREYLAGLESVITGDSPLWYRDWLGVRMQVSAGPLAKKQGRVLVPVSVSLTRVEP